MISTLLPEPRVIPLTRLENGVYRVTGTRIPLERIIEQYKDGATPEEIVSAFDTLRLPDVYTLIGYYLDHREEVEQYLREEEKLAEEIRRRIEAAQQLRPGLKKAEAPDTASENKQSDLLTIEEACERLGVCPRTFRRMVAAGDFPKPVNFPRYSRRLRVPLSDVEKYLESLTANRK